MSIYYYIICKKCKELVDFVGEWSAGTRWSWLGNARLFVPWFIARHHDHLDQLVIVSEHELYKLDGLRDFGVKELVEELVRCGYDVEEVEEWLRKQGVEATGEIVEVKERPVELKLKDVDAIIRALERNKELIDSMIELLEDIKRKALESGKAS